VKYAERYFIFLTLMFLASRVCEAAACYGTRLPEKHHAAIGLETYSMDGRALEDDQGKVSSRQYFLRISYGVFDWLSIDLKGGGGDIRQHATSTDDIDYSSSFAGGYGLRLKLLEHKDAKVVFGFQHVSVHPFHTEAAGVKHRAILDDIEGWVPYLGARWSRVDYIHWIDDARKRVMSDAGRCVGLIAGIDVPFGKRVWMNVEGQFVNETALSVSLNYGF
jgi:hypothetical protein